MAQLQRSLRRLAAVTPAALLLFTSALGGPVHAAQTDSPTPGPTATAPANVSTVSEYDAFKLFNDVAENLQSGPVGWDPNSYLQNQFNSAADDKTRALIVVFKAAGGVEQAREATAEVSRKYRQWDGDSEVWVVPVAETNQTISKYANMPVIDGKESLSWVAETAKVANELLAGAQKHNMSLQVYMNDVYIPFQTKSEATHTIQQAARAFGLGNKTVAMQQSTALQPAQ